MILSDWKLKEKLREARKKAYKKGWAKGYEQAVKDYDLIFSQLLKSEKEKKND